MEEIKFSAKFKRDYVAALAVVLFFLIVAGEVALAIGIPSYLHRENVLAEHVQRLRLLEYFDGTRYMAEYAKGGDAVQSELKLIRWNLNLWANYLREEAPNLSVEEMEIVRKHLERISGFIMQLRKEKPFCREQALDPSIFLNMQVDKVSGKR